MISIRLILVFISTLLVTPQILAKDIIVKKGEIPVWDGSIYTKYQIKMSADVTAFMSLDDGSWINNGKVHPIDSGSFSFTFFNKQDRSIRRREWYLHKPRFYPVHTKIWIDGQLFLEEINPDHDIGKMLIHFPYAIKKVSVTSLYSDGKKYSLAIRTPNIPHRDIHHDTRKSITMSRGKWDKSNKPNSLELGQGAGLLVYGCMSSKKGGYIKSMSAYLHKHPIFASDGDRQLGKYIIHMPVYQVYVQRSWGLRLEIPPKLIYQDHTFKITGTCTMRSGKTITVTKKFTIERETRSVTGR